MFGKLMGLWNASGVVTGIEGVIREAERGNILEAQRWYFYLKKHAFRASKKEGIPAQEIEERALASVRPEQATRFKLIVNQLSQPGEPFEEVNEWLKANRPA